MMAVIGMAGTVVWNAESQASFKALKDAGNLAGATALLDSIAPEGKDAVAYESIALALNLGGEKYTTLAQAQAKVDGIVLKFGVTSNTQKQSMIAMALYYSNATQAFLDYTTTANALTMNEIGMMKFYSYLNLNDKVQAFEYGKKYILTTYRPLAECIVIMDGLGALDFADTTITPEMQLALAKSVNQKYVRFLTSDKDCPWIPFLTALQGQIKQMKEDLGVK